MNIAVDERSSPYYALRDRQGNAIGVTACDIDGDGREEIYFLNTNNAFSGKGLGPRAPTASLPLPPSSSLGEGLPQVSPARAPPGTGPCCLQELTPCQQRRPSPSDLRPSPPLSTPRPPHTLLLAWLGHSALLTGQTAPWNRPPCCFWKCFETFKGPPQLLAELIYSLHKLLLSTYSSPDSSR